VTWLVVRDLSGRTFTEHHALVANSDTVLSRHPTLPEAREALAAYRLRVEREAAREQGQKDLFGGTE
jgi:hypothetical protein